MSNELAKKYRILSSMIICANCDTLFAETAFKKFITLRWPLRWPVLVPGETRRVLCVQ